MILHLKSETCLQLVDDQNTDTLRRREGYPDSVEGGNYLVDQIGGVLLERVCSTSSAPRKYQIHPDVGPLSPVIKSPFNTLGHQYKTMICTVFREDMAHT